MKKDLLKKKIDSICKKILNKTIVWDGRKGGLIPEGKDINLLGKK